MWLHKISAVGFRAFAEASWEFPETGLVFVAGANNSGKSSLLATLDAIARAEEGSQESRKHAGSSGAPTVTATFKLDASDVDSLIPDANLGERLLSESRKTLSMDLVFRQDSQGVLGLSEVDVEWLPGEFSRFAYLEFHEAEHQTVLMCARIPEDGSTSFPSEIVLRQPHSGEIHDIETIGWTFPPTAFIRAELNNWRSRYFHFRALRPGTRRTYQLDSQPTLNPSGENLPAVLLGLITNKPHILQELRRLMSEIVPDVGNLETPTSGNVLEVAFSDPYLPEFRHNLKELGTGVEQLLMTLVVGLTQEVPCTLVIEEPETNLHPAAQRAMLGLLREWSSDRLIVVATHSPVMLDGSDGRETIWHVTRAAGASTVRPIESEPIELYRSLGVRVSDVLSADRILVVEGPSDEEVLSVWFPAYLRSPRLALIHGGGGDNARHAAMLSEWISKSDRLGPRKVLFMRDRDELSPESLTRLSRSPEVYVLKKRELENYLLDSKAVAQALANISPDQSGLPDAATVERAFADAAEALRSAVVVNRVARRIEPIRLMGNELRQALAKSKVDSEAFKAAVLPLVPSPEDISQKVDQWWAAAVESVESLSAKDLLDVAPGADVLDSVFRKFIGRRFNKRSHAVEIARNISVPPEDLSNLLRDFMEGRQ